jgi:general secretion pathway protein A
MNFFRKKKILLNPFLCDPKLKSVLQQDTYENFYGFLKDPFAPHPDPNLFFLTDNCREVWNSMLQGIDERKRFILLTGEGGMGKTTLMALVYLYLTTNGRKVKVIPLFDPPNTTEEILQAVLRYLGFPAKEENKSAMLSLLDEDILQRSAQGETVAMIFDEAQNLRKEVLDEIRLFANPHPRRPKFLQEIFVGTRQFEKNLNGRDLLSLNQSFEVRCCLRPVTLEESVGYIEHRLHRVGGTTSKVFTPRAVYLIAIHAKGIPGTINRVCQEALSVGYTQMKEKADSANVREAIANLRRESKEVWQLREKILSRLKKNSARW